METGQRMRELCRHLCPGRPAGGPPGRFSYGAADTLPIWRRFGADRALRWRCGGAGRVPTWRDPRFPT
eukprot:9503424-Pyramimonas_sp.AAC.1